MKLWVKNSVSLAWIFPNWWILILTLFKGREDLRQDARAALLLWKKSIFWNKNHNCNKFPVLQSQTKSGLLSWFLDILKLVGALQAHLKIPHTPPLGMISSLNSLLQYQYYNPGDHVTTLTHPMLRLRWFPTFKNLKTTILLYALISPATFSGASRDWKSNDELHRIVHIIRKWLSGTFLLRISFKKDHSPQCLLS